jgi:hypothetical protein
VPAGVLAIGGLLLILFVLLAVVHFAMRLVTSVDSAGFHLRIHPTGWSLLPRRMTRWDVPLGDVETCEIATYNSLRSTEFWGWHMWGLSAAKGGRYLYVMNPSGLTTGRGVRLRLRTGEMLLVGSARPEELVGAITQKQSRQN